MNPETKNRLREIVIFALAATFIWVIGYGVAQSAEISNTDMRKQINQTNFLVNKGCSGTLIANDLVLTADHCVASQFEDVEKEHVNADGTVEKKKVRISRPGTVSQIFFNGSSEEHRVTYIYKIKGVDQALDLALLKVQSKLKLTPAQISCKDTDVLDKVYAVGNPYAVLYSSVTEGIVSSINRSYRDLGLAGELGDTTDDGEHGLVQHSAVIYGGNSGGALYDAEGKLVGVNVRGAATGFSFSVPLSDVKKFLHNENVEYLWKDCPEPEK